MDYFWNNNVFFVTQLNFLFKWGYFIFYFLWWQFPHLSHYINFTSFFSCSRNPFSCAMTPPKAPQIAGTTCRSALKTFRIKSMSSSPCHKPEHFQPEKCAEKFANRFSAVLRFTFSWKMMDSPSGKCLWWRRAEQSLFVLCSPKEKLVYLIARTNRRRME